jgi:hypothetical protein
MLFSPCFKEETSYKKKRWRPPSKKKNGGKICKPEEQKGMRHCPLLLLS